MRIAIIGSGISGLYAAHRLHHHHEITVFEAAHYPGGHSNTVDVTLDGRDYAVDTGFIVYNERNYPLFSRMLSELGVTTEPSEMSFSFSCRNSGLEYAGTNLNSLFAQRGNLLRPDFLRMVRDIIRFNRLEQDLLDADADLSLGDFLHTAGLSGSVAGDYLVPMAAAIWSSDPAKILEMPAAWFGRFFSNHGLLQVANQPQWRTIRGGSREYVARLTAPFRDRILLNSRVEYVRRGNARATVKARGLDARIFDAVIMACHSNQALRLLRDPSTLEREILGALPYQRNEAVLHTDTRLLPKEPRAWASWNYHRFRGASDAVSVTYNLSRLQNLRTAEPLLLTLNATNAIDSRHVIRTMRYMHPFYDRAGIKARARRSEISGRRNTWYCGAYWGYGFHEDGVQSAAEICTALATEDSLEQLHLSRVG